MSAPTYYCPKSDDDSTSTDYITGKNVWFGFVTTATTHGILQIYKSKGYLKKIVWIIALLGGTCGLVYQLYLVTSLYLKYNVSPIVAKQTTQAQEFPVVSFCNTNPIKASALHLSPSLQALIDSWKKINRKRRSIEISDDQLIRTDQKGTNIYSANASKRMKRSTVTCRKLFPPGNGYYTSSGCSSKRSPSGTICRAMCDDSSDIFYGNSVVMCESTGNWNMTNRPCCVSPCENETVSFLPCGMSMKALALSTTMGTPNIYLQIWNSVFLRRSGNITQWKFYSEVSGKLYLSIWRAFPGDNFKLVGYNTVQSKGTSMEQVVNIRSNLQISAKAGDCLGLISSRLNPVVYIASEGRGSSRTAGLLNQDLPYGMNFDISLEDIAGQVAFMASTATGSMNRLSAFSATVHSAASCEETTTAATTEKADASTAATTQIEDASTIVTKQISDSPAAVTTQTADAEPTAVITAAVVTKGMADPTAAVTKQMVGPTEAISTQIADVSTAVTTEMADASTAVTKQMVGPTEAVSTQIAGVSTAVTTEMTDASTAITTEMSDTSKALTTEETETHTTVTVAGSTKAALSKSEIILRDDFLRETDVMETLADLSNDEKKKIGYELFDLVISCQYKNKDCNMSEFGYFFDAVNGNCYMFNPRLKTTQKEKVSQRAGPNTGLKMILNLGQHEYVEGISKSAGLVVVVHPKNRMPFPEDEGVYAAPGQITSIGINKVSISRLPHPYGNCSEETSNPSINAFEELYNIEYSPAACYKTCHQKYVIERCNCSDPQYPNKGKAFGDHNFTSCRIRNIHQDECMSEVLSDYIEDKLLCDCPTPCREISYRYQLSKGIWPSDVYKKDFISTYKRSFDNQSSKDPFISKNIVKVEVYFDQLDYKVIHEKPKYPVNLYLADVSSILELWLAISLFSLIELLELASDFIIALFCKIKKPSKLKLEQQGNNSELTNLEQSSQQTPELIRLRTIGNPSSEDQLMVQSNLNETIKLINDPSPTSICRRRRSGTVIQPRISDFFNILDYHNYSTKDNYDIKEGNDINSNNNPKKTSAVSTDHVSFQLTQDTISKSEENYYWDPIRFNNLE